MRRILPLALIGVAALALSVTTALGKEDEPLPRPVGTPTPTPSGDDWMRLLSEENAAHWKNVTNGRKDFRIEDGVMHITGHKPTRYIAWMKQPFSDFHLHVEVKVAPGTNSGVFFRSDPKNPVYGGMEIQVYDDHGEPPSMYGTGGLYDLISPMFNMALPAGEWNTYDIAFVGSRLTVDVNGWTVIDFDTSALSMPVGKFPKPFAELPKEGHVILQDHGGEVWFRNVMVKPL